VWHKGLPNTLLVCMVVLITVRNLAGTELELTLLLTSSVRDVKQQINAHWGVRVTEQNILIDGSIAQDADALIDHMGGDSDNELDVLLIRGPAFNFNKSLAHRNIKLSSGGDAMTHGGKAGYQAAFLSDILDDDGTYRVHFRLEDADNNDFKEMYVGVAPDRNRDWSNLKGAYLNRLGVYVDAFDESGWHHCSGSCLRQQIFKPNAMKQEQLLAKLRQCGSDVLLLDFSTDGDPLVPLPLIQEAWTKEDEEHVKDLVKFREGMQFNACAFIMEVDMSNGVLCFKTVAGEAVERVMLPQLRSEPVRLCATLGYPGQTVSIVDA